MVARAFRIVSLVALTISSSMLLDGVDALPQVRSEMIEVRGHHHHHNGHYHHGHGWDSDRTKVYADDPLIVSGDGNHVHAHLDKRRHHHHGNHHDGHHGTKVYADDPLVVSGNGNHVHAHLDRHHHHEDHHDHHGTKVHADDPLVVSGDDNHVHTHSQRGLVDPLVPLLSVVPGLPGIIDLVNTVSHAVLSERLASLIIAPKPTSASTQSTGENNNDSGFVISASNSSSSVMYLLPQNISTFLASPKHPVLITMPMFDENQKGLKMYCASYDPNPSAPIQISSEPCVATSATSDGNSTGPHTSQLFSWDQQSGEIAPLWHKDANQPLVDTTSAPGGAPDPASHVKRNGFVVGQSVAPTGDGQVSPGTVAMVFRAIEPQPTNSPMTVSGQGVSLTSTTLTALGTTVAAMEATLTQSVTETTSTSAVGSTSSAAP